MVFLLGISLLGVFVDLQDSYEIVEPQHNFEVVLKTTAEKLDAKSRSSNLKG